VGQHHHIVANALSMQSLLPATTRPSMPGRMEHVRAIAPAACTYVSLHAADRSQGLWLTAPAPAEAVPHFLRYEADDVREAITATSKLRPDQVRRLHRDQRSADPSHMIGVTPRPTSSSACSSCALKGLSGAACLPVLTLQASDTAQPRLCSCCCLAHHAPQPGLRHTSKVESCRVSPH
jgi:hypothetical protein